MNLEELKQGDFKEQINKVLSGEIKVYEVKDFEGTMDEIDTLIEEQLGERHKELFILSTTKKKEDFPEQKENILISFSITRQENKFNI